MARSTSRRTATVAAARKAPEVLVAARRLLPELVEVRRRLHAWPELGHEESETGKLVKERLAGLGLKPRGMGGTGVTANLEGRNRGDLLMIRADMDALPILEETGLPFASKVPGKMHACGHDFHTSILLATARLLSENRPDRGSIRFNFQPAEEVSDGAEGMIRDGILEGVDVCFGYHIWQGIPVGKVGIISGPCMAAVDEFKITITGRGGHAAYPHLAVDPVLIAAQVVTALQSIASRNVNPIDSVVVTVAAIHGGTAFNIIPPSVELTGTVRSFSREVRREVPKRMSAIVKQVTAAFGGRGDLDYKQDTPPVVNHPKLADFMRQVAADVVGPENLVQAEPSMGGEDMAFYQEKVPGCYIFIGSAPKGTTYEHHHPRFNPDEGVLPVATAIMTEAARRWLARR